MGGVLIVISIIVPTLLWADLRYLYVWIAMLALLCFAGIGFIDDYAKVMKQRNLGLTSKTEIRACRCWSPCCSPWSSRSWSITARIRPR